MAFILEQEEIYDFVLGCSENSKLIDFYQKDMHEQVVKSFNDYQSSQYNEN